jgi:hypothetical protein
MRRSRRHLRMTSKAFLVAVSKAVVPASADQQQVLGPPALSRWGLPSG